MDIEYKNIPEVDEQIFAEEMNEPKEDFPVDDFFNEDDQTDDEEDIFNENKPEVVQRLNIDAVNVFVDTFTSMIASFFSALTEQSAQRYTPPAQQRRSLSKAIIEAFPSVQLNPATALVFAVVMTYAPITVNLVKDVKAKNNINNEKNANDNSPRYKRNGQNNIPEENPEANKI